MRSMFCRFEDDDDDIIYDFRSSITIPYDIYLFTKLHNFNVDTTNYFSSSSQHNNTR
jgi:hypothetical protein